MTRTDAAGEVAALADLSREELIARWAALHGKAPPRAITRDLLLRGLAYSLQERAHGGLGAREARDLMALAKGKRPLGPKTLMAGTRLYREWRGRAHEVLALAEGYSWQGRTYKSLSEVARAITGTRWSGPRFFGVKV